MRPSELWNLLAKWFESVLIQIKPKRIICSGNDKSRGPWAAIKKRFEWDCPFCDSLGGSYALKGLRIKSGPLAGTEVLGIPNLGWSKNPGVGEGGAMGL